MKKSISILLTFILSISLFAQSGKSKKVKTKFLQLPSYDISQIDPASVKAEFVAGDASFGDPQMKDVKTVCVPKGGKLTDAVEVTTYYYDIPMVKPAAYLVGRDGAGKVIYAEQVSLNEEISVNFGYKECAYWIAENMKKEWNENQGKYKAEQTLELEKSLLADAQQLAKENIYPSYISEEIEVYSAKGKDFDYSELDKALTEALAAYEEIGKSGPTKDALNKLNGCISIWEKEVAQIDEEDKKARINKSIGKGLFENLEFAYKYTYQIDKAIDAANKGKKLYGNFSNNRSMALDSRLNKLYGVKTSVDNNSGIVADKDRLSVIASQIGSANVDVIRKSKNELASLEADYKTYTSENLMAKHEAKQQNYDKAVASGEVNPYEKYVTNSATQGKIIMMTALTMAPELKEFPKEICEISDLQQVMIQGNKIETIPAEISNLKQLTKLTLSNNNISKLPLEIGALKNLKTLNLNNNPLTEIPEEIKNCSSLKTLNLKGTKLSAEHQKKLAQLLPDAKIKF